MGDLEFDLDMMSAEELADALLEASRKVPTEFEKTLKAEQAIFKGMVIKETRAATETHSGNLTKGFRFDGPYRDLENFYTDFLAEGKKNPHWHLIENGHEMVTNVTRNGKHLKDGGKTVGWVPGYRIMDPVVERFQETHTENMRRAMERIIKELK